ncbi:MAG: hypothetical protein O2895_06365 [Chloroflexi bacterium]|nr:hypothetical protein [Chloroflexota bacterium]
MNERSLSLDPAERQLLAQAIAADETWPPRDDHAHLLEQVLDGAQAGEQLPHDLPAAAA